MNTGNITQVLYSLNNRKKYFLVPKKAHFTNFNYQTQELEILHLIETG